MEENYLSIKEFAGLAGVSPQAVYQRIDKDLKEYVQVIDGKKAIDIKALDLFSVQSVEQPVDNELTSILRETLKVLSGQLTEKDKQIAELNERLKESNELNRNNQILIGRQQDQPKQIEESAPIPEPEKRGFWSRFRKES
ncbi:MAG: hypothetical protein ACOH15_07345 [Acetobacterium sp.]